MATRIIRSICQYIWLGQADTELCNRILCVRICLLDCLNLRASINQGAEAKGRYSKRELCISGLRRRIQGQEPEQCQERGHAKKDCTWI